MPSTFELNRNAVVINLKAGRDAGWNAEDWRPNVALTSGNRMPPNVREDIRLLPSATSHDALATDFQELDNYRWLAREYIKDRTQEHPVWLYAQMTNETAARRALVYDMSLKWRTQEVDDDELWICDNRARVQMGLTRGPFWERTAATTTATGTGLSILGGAFDYTAGGGADVVGDAPARVDALTLRVEQNTPPTYYQAWVGFRSVNKHGTIANFVPLWELESGVAGADTALFADATASPGGGGNTCMRCTFAGTATWTNRVNIRLSHVTANYGDNFGRYVILLRARVDAGTTAEVQMRRGLINDLAPGNLVQGPILEVTNSAYAMFNLGTTIFPTRDWHALPLANYAASYNQQDYIFLYARRTGGAGNLYLDCIGPIPADELFLHIESARMYTSTVLYSGIISQAPEGHWAGHSVLVDGADYFNRMPTVSTSGLGVPIGDGRMYTWFADSDGENILTDTYQGDLTLFPRWYNLRGAE
jgi:hypothetical protein